MGYGNDENVQSVGTDYSSDLWNVPDESNDKPAPVIDPSKFVPIEKYEALESKFSQVEPKLGFIDKMQQVFSQDAGQPSLTPEQQALAEFVDSRAKYTFNAETQALREQNDFFASQMLSKTAGEYGFRDSTEATNWAYMAQYELQNKAIEKNDYAGMKLAKTFSEVLNSNNTFQAIDFVTKNFSKINQYLQGSPYARTAPSPNQTIGMSFSNNTFKSFDQPKSPQDYQEAISKARKAGDEATVERLLKEQSQIIQTMLGG